MSANQSGSNGNSGASPAVTTNTNPNKPRKPPRKMQALIGKLEKSGEAGVEAVFTVYKTCGVNDKTIRKAAEQLGPGTFCVLTGRFRGVSCCETKRLVAKLG